MLLWVVSGLLVLSLLALVGVCVAYYALAVDYCKCDAER